jgi:hypothetical protein
VQMLLDDGPVSAGLQVKHVLHVPGQRCHAGVEVRALRVGHSLKTLLPHRILLVTNRKERDSGLRHNGATPARGWRGDDTAQEEGSSPVTSRWRRRGRGRWSALAALGHAWLSGDLCEKTEER